MNAINWIVGECCWGTASCCANSSATFWSSYVALSSSDCGFDVACNSTCSVSASFLRTAKQCMGYSWECRPEPPPLNTRSRVEILQTQMGSWICILHKCTWIWVTLAEQQLQPWHGLVHHCKMHSSFFELLFFSTLIVKGGICSLLALSYLSRCVWKVYCILTSTDAYILKKVGSFFTICSWASEKAGCNRFRDHQLDFGSIH